MFAISPTDNNWFSFLKNSNFNSYVNFWTPTPWNINKLKQGDRLYFMLKAPIRKIGGFGEFHEYKNLTAIEAWNKFGYRNGRNSQELFFSSIQKYTNKNNKQNDKEINLDTHEIGCIILKNCEFWDNEMFLNTQDFEIDFPPQVVTIKYFPNTDPITKRVNLYKNNFNLVTEQRSKKKAETNIREGQSDFKGKILKTYNNKCCISEETTPELLEAAHIQGYINKQSNHVQNGLLLRVDLHKLYDNGLLFIDSNYTIHISNLIESENYKQYNGKSIILPDDIDKHPSKEALELRRQEFRN